MGIFSKNKTKFPRMPQGDCEPVLRCSICTGEQVLCARDRETGKLAELMVVREPADLDGFCKENGISPADIQKVY